MQPLKHLLLLCAAASACAYATPARSATRPRGATRPLPPTIDPIIDDYERRGVLSGTLLVRRGTCEYTRGAGFADAGKHLRNSIDTRFPIASLTKSFVAAAILQLEEAKLLHTSDPLARHLPDYPQRRLAADPRTEVTLHHLLNHTAGLPDPFTTADFKSRMFQDPLTFPYLVETTRNEALRFVPGSKLEYSNMGYVLLGEIIRRTSKMSFGRYLDEHFLRPLELTRTTIDLPLDAQAILARPYESDAGHADMIEKYRLRTLHLGDVSTDGNIVSTVTDLARWVDKLSTGQVLSAEATKRMFTPSSVAPFGYGWMISTDSDGRKVYKHGGDWVGWKSYALRYPDQDLTLVLLTNQPMTLDQGKALIGSIVGAVLALPSEACAR